MADTEGTKPDSTNAIIVYALFALGYFTVITALAGVIFAYVFRGKDAILDSHFTFMIRTFWISLGLGIIGMLLLVVGIGFLVLLFVSVWGLTRIISGFLLLQDGRPVARTELLGLIAKG